MHARIKTHYGIHNPDEYNIACRDVAQLGSALPWGGRGQGFESPRSDQSAHSPLPEMAKAFSFASNPCFLLARAASARHSYIKPSKSQQEDSQKNNRPMY